MKDKKTSVEIKHVGDEAMSIHKRKKGRGYQYFDEEGKR